MERAANWLLSVHVRSLCTHFPLNDVTGSEFIALRMRKCAQSASVSSQTSSKKKSARDGPLGTALGALLRLLNALMCPKEVEASSFLFWRYRIYIPLDIGPAGSVGCVARVPSMARL